MRLDSGGWVSASHEACEGMGNVIAGPRLVGAGQPNVSLPPILVGKAK